MSTKLLVSKLISKRVMDVDGTNLGTLLNLLVELETGEIAELLVEPELGLDLSGFKVQDDLILIPFSQVKSIKDLIVIDRRA